MNKKIHSTNIPLVPFLDEEEVQGLCDVILLEYERIKLLLTGTSALRDRITDWRERVELDGKLSHFIEFRDADLLGYNPVYGIMNSKTFKQDILRLLKKIEAKLDFSHKGELRTLRQLLKLLPVQATELEAMAKAEGVDTSILDQARNRLVLHNTKLAYGTANAYFRRQSDHAFEDVLQEAFVILHAVTSLYRSSRGFKFYTYASYYIKGHLSAALNERARLVHIPDSAVRRHRMILKTAKQLGGNASDVEIAEKTGMDLKEIQETRLDVETYPLHLDMPVSANNPDGDDLKDMIEDDSMNAQDIMEYKDRISTLMAGLRSLPAKEEQVLRMRFGIGGVRTHTLDEIAVKRGVSREAIRQNELKALRDLRKNLLEAREELQS